jgi:predicted RNA-binding Zn-ribbon protein involved in translation (DUF1610 family)
MTKPFCICGEPINFLMDNKTKEAFECPKCGNLMLHKKDDQIKIATWYEKMPFLQKQGVAETKDD